VDDAIASFHDESASYFILDKGREPGEVSAIYIAKGHYLGFGFYFGEPQPQDTEPLKDVIKWRPDTPDVQRILAGWMGRNAVRILPDPTAVGKS
jgi:hypothetical protein